MLVPPLGVPSDHAEPAESILSSDPTWLTWEDTGGAAGPREGVSNPDWGWRTAQTSWGNGLGSEITMSD